MWGADLLVDDAFYARFALEEAPIYEDVQPASIAVGRNILTRPDLVGMNVCVCRCNFRCVLLCRLHCSVQRAAFNILIVYGECRREGFMQRKGTRKSASISELIVLSDMLSHKINSLSLEDCVVAILTVACRVDAMCSCLSVLYCVVRGRSAFWIDIVSTIAYPRSGFIIRFRIRHVYTDHPYYVCRLVSMGRRRTHVELARRFHMLYTQSVYVSDLDRLEHGIKWDFG